MKYQVAHHSMQGARRSNQDRVAVAERENAVLMVLADGLGGHKGGAIAAEIMTQWAVRAFLGVRQATITQPSAFLALTILQAHNQITAYGKAQTPPIKPRTTCVLCLVQNGYAYWAHVGDSRLYHFRDDALLSRTVDHSTIEKLHEQGLISADEMQNHPQRSSILKCVGGPNKPVISLGEEVTLHPGDRLLLCSDGVWDAHSPEALLSFLKNTDLDLAIDELLHATEARMKEACDNISAICLRWDDRITTSPPLQKTRAGTIDQKTLWETARKRVIAGKVKATRAKGGAANKRGGAPETTDKDKVESTIKELERYLSQYPPKN